MTNFKIFVIEKKLQKEIKQINKKIDQLEAGARLLATVTIIQFNVITYRSDLVCKLLMISCRSSQVQASRIETAKYGRQLDEVYCDFENKE